MQAHERLMMPFAIGPGAIAFTDAGTLGGATPDWDDVRVRVDSVDTGPSDLGTSLTLEELNENQRGEYSGTVANDSKHSVSDITFSFACVDEDGRIVDFSHPVSDLRKLDAGDEEQFEVSDANGSCDSDSDVMVSINARIRD